MEKDIEEIKDEVLGYLAKNDSAGAVIFVRNVTRLTLKGAVNFVLKVKKEATPDKKRCAACKNEGTFFCIRCDGESEFLDS